MTSDAVPNRFSRSRWLAGVLLVLALGPLLLWWWLNPWGVVYPVERYMPDHCAAALRITQPRLMWQSHWQGEGIDANKPSAERALRRILEANGSWQEMVEKHGEVMAQTRLTLVESAFFRAIGDEAWVIFGEWNSGGKPGEGEVGLIALVRGDTVTGRFGPLMKFVMDNDRVEQTTYRGVDLYEYHNAKLGRAVTLCHLGGWIVASLRQRDQNAIHAIIDQVQGDVQDKAFAAYPDVVWPDLLEQRKRASIFAVAQPEYIWPHMRQFNQQRGRRFSRESEDSIKSWEQRLDGVQRIDLYQQGRSMLDFQLELRGPRPTLVARQMHEETQRAEASASRSAGEAPAPVAEAPTLPPELLQLDCSLAFARMALPLAGLSWNTLLKDAGALRMVAPQLVITLEEELADAVGESAGRLGLAAWPSQNTIAPAGLLWRDYPPEAAVREAPAQYWAPRAVDADPFGGDGRSADTPADYAEWVIPLGGRPLPASPEQRDLKPWRTLSAAQWADPPRRPEAYLTLHFETLSRMLHALPTGLMKKKSLKRFEKTRSTIDALDVLLGGVVLRLDADEERWALTCRTL